MNIQHTLDTSLILILLFIYTTRNVNVVSSPVPQTVGFPKDVNFPDEDTENVRKCLEDDYSMPYYNSLIGQVECHALLTRGPCRIDEWFVIDRNTNVKNSELPQAICKKRECGSLPTGFNTSALQERVMFNGRCTNVTSSKECTSTAVNQIVLVNPLGEGECACKDRFIEWTQSENSNTQLPQRSGCYQEYLQGPCESGHQLVSKEEEESRTKVNQKPPALIFGELAFPGNAKVEEDLNLSGSICIRSDCEKEGYVRLQSGQCVNATLCPLNTTLVLANEFSNNKNQTAVGFNFPKEEKTCCLTDHDLALIKDSIEQGVSVEDACIFRFSPRSALVTIPESCPRGQTMTHDGECKVVRIWRSRPRRSANSNNRIRQMMRYVRSLRKSPPTFE